MNIKQTVPEKVFMVFCYTLVTAFSLLCLYPIVYVFSASISAPTEILKGSVVLLPKSLTLDSYKMLLRDNSIYIAYLNTIFYAVVGTLYSLTMDVLLAYPLSKRRLMGRRGVSLGITFTMWFSAGMIPFYLLIRGLHLLDNRWGLILPFASTPYYVILLRTFFSSIPESLEEAAKIDGAGDMTILWRIYLPLSKAALATVALYIIVGRWNSYFWASVLLKDPNKIPLQVLLRNMVVRMGVNASGDAEGGITNLSAETMVYATMMIAVVPMLIVYPFIQKYFVKGVMIGGIKG